MTRTQLLDRCCTEPNAHIALMSCDQYLAYEMGYGSLDVFDEETFSEPDFKAAIRHDYSIPAWPTNLSTLSMLSAIHGPGDDLRMYLRYCQQLAKAANRNDDTDYSRFDPFEFLKPGSSLRQRLDMFLGMGNDASSEHVWSLLSGRRWAELDSGIDQAETVAFMANFQSWMEARFPFSRNIPWGRTIRFLSVGSSSRSLGHFFEYFDFFRQGEPANCLSFAARTMIATITQDYGELAQDQIDTIHKKIAPV